MVFWRELPDNNTKKEKKTSQLNKEAKISNLNKRKKNKKNSKEEAEWSLFFVTASRWAHHLLKLCTGDAYDRGKLGVGSARRDGREFPTTGRVRAGGGFWW